MTIKRLLKQTAYGALFASAAALAGAGTASAATEGYGDCPLTGEKGSAKINPAVDGQFTVIINLPALGQFNGDTPDTIKDGYEFCMAVNIAHRLGLDKVKLVNASFDSIVAGQNKDYDIALALISVTEPRKKVVDFSVPYMSSAYGVAARADKPVTEADMKTGKIGTQAGTTLVQFAQDTLKVASLDVFDDTASMFTALAAGKVDAVMTDLSIILGQVHNSNGKLAVVGKYESGGQTAGIYPKGSENKKVIDQLIEDMEKDGTLKKLEAATCFRPGVRRLPTFRSGSLDLTVPGSQPQRRLRPGPTVPPHTVSARINHVLSGTGCRRGTRAAMACPKQGSHPWRSFPVRFRLFLPHPSGCGPDGL
ncbi:hypothetical protein Q644_25135 [Brucella intermedia 229E]|uniref:Solute-binding protein family 3/N-terminal domain-containing protein n=1 Tax=Brucella intermedia 229E TaxID=1337887 RepID=U4V7V4_9HYPH|nr:hypothetical protein Q644_25135 [Brucella intermedia 229E]